MDKIDQRIIELCSNSPTNPSLKIRQEFKISSQQAVHKRLKKLVDARKLESTGSGKGRKYLTVSSKNLPSVKTWEYKKSELSARGEDLVYKEDIFEHFKEFSKNSESILYHIISEMLNNCIDHSQCETIEVKFFEDKTNAEIQINDDGVGVFQTVKTFFKLSNFPEAIAEIVRV